MTNIHIGSYFDEFLQDEGINEEVSASAIRVLSWQLRQQIEEQGISKTELARRMSTSHSQVDRLLNANGAEIKLSTLERATKAVNRSLVLHLP